MLTSHGFQIGGDFSVGVNQNRFRVDLGNANFNLLNRNFSIDASASLEISPAGISGGVSLAMGGGGFLPITGVGGNSAWNITGSFDLEFSPTITAFGVSGSVTVMGSSLGIDGLLDSTGHGILAVTATQVPIGFSGSSLVVSGTMSLSRLLSNNGSSSITTFGISNAAISWFGTSIEIEQVQVGSNGSFGARMAAQQIDLAQGAYLRTTSGLDINVANAAQFSVQIPSIRLKIPGLTEFPLTNGISIANSATTSIAGGSVSMGLGSFQISAGLAIERQSSGYRISIEAGSFSKNTFDAAVSGFIETDGDYNLTGTVSVDLGSNSLIRVVGDGSVTLSKSGSSTTSDLGISNASLTVLGRQLLSNLDFNFLNSGNVNGFPISFANGFALIDQFDLAQTYGLTFDIDSNGRVELYRNSNFRVDVIPGADLTFSNFHVAVEPGNTTFSLDVDGSLAFGDFVLANASFAASRSSSGLITLGRSAWNRT